MGDKTQQVIKHRKGCIDKVKDINSYLSEIIYGTGEIGDLRGNVVFIGNKDGGIGNYSPISKIYFGTNVPTVNGYGNTLNGLPFYSVYDKTLYILNNPKNIDMDLSGNIYRRNIAPNNISSSGYISGNSLNITGDVTLGKGDNIITINGKIKNSLIPSVSNTFDLGNPSFKWRNIFANNISASFQGDGSQLTGLNTSMSIEMSGSSNNSFNISLPNERLKFYTDVSKGLDLLITSKRIDIVPFNSSYTQRGMSYYNIGDFNVINGFVSIDYQKLNNSSSFNIFTSSVNTQFNNFSNYTSSFNTTFSNFSSSVSSSLQNNSNSINLVSQSLYNYIIFNNNVLNNFSNYTSSFNTTFSNFSSSVNSQLLSFKNYTSSFNTTFSNFSSSVSSNLTIISSSLNNFSSSIVGYNKTINTALNQLLVGSSSYSNTLNVNVLSNSIINFKLSDNLYISSSINTTTGFFTGNVTIQGNLYVTGSVNAISSSVIQVGTNILNLNATSSFDGGIHIYALNSNTTGSLLYDVNGQFWKVGLIGNEKRIVTQASNSPLTPNSLVFANNSGSLISAIAPITNDIPIWNGSTWNNINLSTLVTTSSLNTFLTGSYFKQGGNSFSQSGSLGTNDNYSLVFKTNNLPRMVLTNTGNILVNKVSDSDGSKLQIDGNVYLNGFLSIGKQNPQYNIDFGITGNTAFAYYDTIYGDTSGFSIQTIINADNSTIFGLLGSSNLAGIVNGIPSSTILANYVDKPIQFATNGINRLTIFGDGNISNTNSNLGYKLNILGDINYTTLLKVNGSSGTNGQFLKTLGSSNQWSNILTTDVTGLNTWTGSVSSSLISLNSYTSSNNIIINNFSVYTSSINTWTGSVLNSLNNFSTHTSSINTWTGSVSSSLISLNSYTSSNNTIINNFSVYTSSLNIQTGSFFKQGGNSFGETAVLGTNDNNYLSFVTNGSSRLIIDENGKVGIGVYPNDNLSIASTNTNIGITLSTLTYATSNGRIVLDNRTNIPYESELYFVLKSKVGRNIIDTEIMTLKYNGNVGFNNTSPTEKIDVNGNINYTTLLKVNGSSGTNGQFLKTLGSSNSWSNILTSDVTGLNTWTGSVDTQLNNFSVYTSSLNVQTGSFFKQGGNSFGASAILGTNDNFSLNFRVSGSTKMVINTDGKIIIGSVTSLNGMLNVGGDIISTGTVSSANPSDIRLKNNLSILKNPLLIIDKLTGYNFEWNNNQVLYKNGQKDIGFIAQDVEKILPDIVFDRFDGYKSVKYDRIIPILVEGIKELKNRISIIENTNATR